MDISALQAFTAVAETASFSAAAERLHLTQPAVSKRVAGLEGELRTRLFDRIGRRITLTEAGQALLPRARRILAELEDTRRVLSNLAGVVAGRLSIATSHHIGLHRLPAVLRAFTTHYPDVTLDLRFLESENALHEVERGELELAIVTLPTTPPPVLRLIPLWEDPLAVVVAPDHPLAGAAQLAPAQLLAYPAILPDRGTYTRELIEDAFRPYGSPEVGLSTNYLETIRMLVAVGLGWGVLPETMLDREMVRLDFAALSLRRTLGVVMHRERSLSNAASALLDLLTARGEAP